MTDETSEPDPRTDAVRRLLAEARHDEPMPADVAARMDGVLAELAVTPVADPAAVAAPEPRPPRPSQATVTELPVHRRRRAGALLAAAAAIVVGGVVLAQHLPGGGSAAEETAGSAAAGGATADSTDIGGSSDSAAQAPSAQSSPLDEAGKLVLRDGVVVVRGRTFPTDARAGQSMLSSRRTHPLAEPQPPCPTPSADEQVVAALYRKAPAALVYHAPDGSTQVVDLVVCGSRRPIRSVTLPAP